MNEKKCNACQNFVQHYGLGSRKLYRLYCGHCTVPKVKRRDPDAKACEHFLPGPPDEEAFATQEYLSKELLQYVLSLPLLPEIEEYSTPQKRKDRKE